MGGTRGKSLEVIAAESTETLQMSKMAEAVLDMLFFASFCFVTSADCLAGLKPVLFSGVPLTKTPLNNQI